MKRYIAYFEYYYLPFQRPGVYEIEVQKETPKMFYYKDSRYYKKYGSDTYSYHLTREAARDALVKCLEEQESIKLQKADLLKREARELRGLIDKLTEERKENEKIC